MNIVGYDEHGEKLKCLKCGNEFIFTHAQIVFFAERGFDSRPKYCDRCSKLVKKNSGLYNQSKEKYIESREKYYQQKKIARSKKTKEEIEEFKPIMGKYGQIRKCKSCSKKYLFSKLDMDYFRRFNLRPPLKCKECKKQQKATNTGIKNINLFDADEMNEIGQKLQKKRKKKKKKYDIGTVNHYEKSYVLEKDEICVRVLGTTKKYAEMRQAFETMLNERRNKQQPMHIYTYNYVFQHLAKDTHPKKCYTMKYYYDKLVEDNDKDNYLHPKPTLNTFNKLILAFSQSPQEKHHKTFLNEIISDMNDKYQIPFNHRTYIPLIVLYEKLGDEEKFDYYMKCLMADESMTGDDGVSDKVKRYLRRMYTELINISLERQNYKKILKFVQDIIKYDIVYKPIDKMKVGNEHIKPTYKSKKPLTDALFKIYEKNLWKIKLTETTGPYDALTIAYNTLMHLHCQLGDYEAAIEVFETIQNMEINEKLINADTFNVVLELFSNQDDSQQVFKYYGMMKKMRSNTIHQDNTMVKPNIKTYTILLNEYAKMERYDEMKKSLHEMINVQQVHPDRSIYNTFIAYHCLSGDLLKATRWFEHMKHGNIQPSVFTYNILYFTSILNRDYKRAHSILNEVITFNKLINKRNVAKDFDPTYVLPDTKGFIIKDKDQKLKFDKRLGNLFGLDERNTDEETIVIINDYFNKGQLLKHFFFDMKDKVNYNLIVSHYLRYDSVGIRHAIDINTTTDGGGGDAKDDSDDEDMKFLFSLNVKNANKEIDEDDLDYWPDDDDEYDDVFYEYDNDGNTHYYYDEDDEKGHGNYKYYAYKKDSVVQPI